jgi:hypothetical protein
MLDLVILTRTPFLILVTVFFDFWHHVVFGSTSPDLFLARPRATDGPGVVTDDNGGVVTVVEAAVLVPRSGDVSACNPNMSGVNGGRLGACRVAVNACARGTSYDARACISEHNDPMHLFCSIMIY